MKNFKYESPRVLRLALNMLLVSETEAIRDYDNVLLDDSLLPEHRKFLEEIRNDEISHIAKLTEIYKSLATGAVESDAKPFLKDSAKVHKCVGGFVLRDSVGTRHSLLGEEVIFQSVVDAEDYLKYNLGVGNEI